MHPSNVSKWTDRHTFQNCQCMLGAPVHSLFWNASLMVIQFFGHTHNGQRSMLLPLFYTKIISRLIWKLQKLSLYKVIEDIEQPLRDNWMLRYFENNIIDFGRIENKRFSELLKTILLLSKNTNIRRTPLFFSESYWRYHALGFTSLVSAYLFFGDVSLSKLPHIPRF